MLNHHALVYVADSIAATDLPATLMVPSVDVVHLVVDRLRIDDARQVIADALAKPVTLASRTIVIAARDLQPEAQNALLKLFEEPPATTRFVLVVPRFDMLLPTLRSRVLYVGTAAHVESADTYFSEFIEASYADRLAQVANFAKEKDTAAMEAIVRGAEAYAAANPLTNTPLLKTVLAVRDYFAFPGASRKMLLESLALALPAA